MITKNQRREYFIPKKSLLNSFVLSKKIPKRQPIDPNKLIYTIKKTLKLIKKTRIPKTFFPVFTFIGKVREKNR
jgi:hypothetical protein